MDNTDPYRDPNLECTCTNKRTPMLARILARALPTTVGWRIVWSLFWGWAAFALCVLAGLALTEPNSLVREGWHFFTVVYTFLIIAGSVMTVATEGAFSLWVAVLASVGVVLVIMGLGQVVHYVAGVTNELSGGTNFMNVRIGG